MPTVISALAHTQRALEDAAVQDARLEAEVLIMEAADWSRASLYTRWTEPITAAVEASLNAMLKRRLRGEPLAYVTGHRDFAGRRFEVTPAVLIPRPETELLVEAAAAWLTVLAPARAEPVEGRASTRIQAADVGTGSGIIAITLAGECPDLTVYATDLSPDALAVARQNARKHGVEDRITFLEGDLLSALPGPVDLIGANLPYVRQDQLPQWCGAAQVELSFEPFDALCGGEDGLDVIRRFLALAPGYLNPGGAVFMEIAYDQGRAVEALAREAFPAARITVQKDLAGLDRLVIIETSTNA